MDLVHELVSCLLLCSFHHIILGNCILQEGICAVIVALYMCLHICLLGALVYLLFPKKSIKKSSSLLYFLLLSPSPPSSSLSLSPPSLFLSPRFCPRCETYFISVCVCVWFPLCLTKVTPVPWNTPWGRSQHDLKLALATLTYSHIRRPLRPQCGGACGDEKGKLLTKPTGKWGHCSHAPPGLPHSPVLVTGERIMRANDREFQAELGALQEAAHSKGRKWPSHFTTLQEQTSLFNPLSAT